jgi:hypothetical protein
MHASGVFDVQVVVSSDVPFTGRVRVLKYVTEAASCSSFSLNCSSSREMVYFISSIARFCPRQIRGPACVVSDCVVQYMAWSSIHPHKKAGLLDGHMKN